MMKVMMGMMVLAVLGLAGCQTADPASRSNHAQYRDLYVSVTGEGNTVHYRVGDGLYASADARDSADAVSSAPALDVVPNPEVAVALPGGSADIGVVGEALHKLLELWDGKKSVTLTEAEVAAVRGWLDAQQ